MNNAGYGLIGAIEEVDKDDARGLVNTYLLGTLWTSQAVLLGMQGRRSGQVVQIPTIDAAAHRRLRARSAVPAVRW